MLRRSSRFGLYGCAFLVLSCERGSAAPASAPPPPLVERRPAVAYPAHGPAHPHAAPPERRRAPARPRSPHHSEESRRMAARFHGRPAKSRAHGLASYYSDALAGRRTASGEPYEPRAYTAAHRTLPFGSVVRVVREDSGQIIYVRINDRGPFVRGRVLDLSRAAAEAIDMIERGVVRVRVELVERGAEPRPKDRPRGRGKRRRM